MSYKANPREIRALVNLAQESLESAKLRLDENFFRGSVSDSYYAAFYITKAALLNNDIIRLNIKNVHLKQSFYAMIKPKSINYLERIVNNG